MHNKYCTRLSALQLTSWDIANIKMGDIAKFIEDVDIIRYPKLK